MVSRLIRNQLPGNRLRVRLSCPPLSVQPSAAPGDGFIFARDACFASAKRGLGLAMKYEVEQKFPLADPQRVVAQLATLGVQPLPAVEQADLYFNHPAKNFKETDEALRIRRVGRQNCVTYKGPKIDAETKTRREIELPLAPGEESYLQFAELLVVLGFIRVFEVRKQRREAELTWQGQLVHIALDDVVALGKFIELEISAEADQLADAKAALTSLAKFLELHTSERRGYLDLLLENLV